MKDDEWHSGPPPSIGWWPASWVRYSDCYRWWNGEHWSVSLKADAEKDTVEFYSKKKDCGQEYIEWKHRPDNWPERSKT